MPKPTISWLQPRQPAEPAVKKNPEVLARDAGFRCIAGVDEAGRGPWAGPVVAAAVILPSDPLPTRLDDSKRLTPLQRARACAVILERAEVGVGIVDADAIDHHNIHHATLLAMRHAIADLPSPADLVLVDGAHVPILDTPCWPFIDGDARSAVIGAASIVAKVVRDRLMAFYDRVAPGYGFERHKGYGTALHAARLRRLGPSIFHRRTFQPVWDALHAA